MFYLLENHKIIDTNELLNSGIQISIKKSQKFKVVYLIGWFGERFFGKIEKQSENVIDLIEVGDLIIGYYKEPLIVKENLYYDKEFLGSDDTCVIGYEDITAIYKPNSKGDYIKVWEKKDDK